MATFILQCQYPFWLPNKALFHTQIRRIRLEIFQDWKNQLGNKNEVYNQKNIFEAPRDLIRDLDWKIVGFENEESSETELLNSSPFPVNFAATKGGVLVGKKSYSISKVKDSTASVKPEEGGITLPQVLSIPDEGTGHAQPNGKAKLQVPNEANPIFTALLNKFSTELNTINHGNAHFDLELKEISFEISFLDWSLGMISISFKTELKNWGNKTSIEKIKDLGEVMQNIFTESYKDLESVKGILNDKSRCFKFIGNDEHNIDEILPKEEEKAGKEETSVNPLSEIRKRIRESLKRRGGFKNPFFIFLVEIIQEFSSRCSIDLKNLKNYGPLVTDGSNGHFFDTQLEIEKEYKWVWEMCPFWKNKLERLKSKDENKIPPFNEAIRLPFVSMNFLFFLNKGENSNKDDLDVLVKDGPQQKGNQNNPDQHFDENTGIKQFGAGFDGNYLVISNSDSQLPSSPFEDSGKNSNGTPPHKLKKYLFLIYLGNIYFSGLDRIQSHLVSRNGLHVELMGKVASGAFVFSPDSVEREIQRMESMKIAIETILQESSTVFLCDNHYYRTMYEGIRKSLHFDSLAQNVREQLPSLIEDLNSDNQKRQAESLSGLRYITMVSLATSVIGFFHDLFGIKYPELWDILVHKGVLWRFPSECESFRKGFNGFLVIFGGLIILGLIYNGFRSAYSKKNIFYLFGREVSAIIFWIFTGILRLAMSIVKLVSLGKNLFSKRNKRGRKDSGLPVG
ncbi:MAG: hypothetical protein H6581_31565 [Bacteroidia bacterium]|nr:hypothetical protein [Bacteroidia bacterium]